MEPKKCSTKLWNIIERCIGHGSVFLNNEQPFKFSMLTYEFLEYPLHAMGLARVMMTSSNGNIFRVTGPLCGEFTGPGEFPAQRPVTRSFGVFFDLRPNKRLSKQPLCWWFETPSWSLWRHCKGQENEEGVELCYPYGIATLIQYDTLKAFSIPYYMEVVTSFNSRFILFAGARPICCTQTLMVN